MDDEVAAKDASSVVVETVGAAAFLEKPFRSVLCSSGVDHSKSRAHLEKARNTKLTGDAFSYLVTMFKDIFAASPAFDGVRPIQRDDQDTVEFVGASV